MKKKLMLLLLALCLLLTGCAQEESHSTPTSIVVWHYYSGLQQEAFQAQVDAFNHTVGLAGEYCRYCSKQIQHFQAV